MDVEAHDALLCVLTGKLISDEKRLRYTGTEYIKSENEMLELFKDHIDDVSINEAVNNTVEISQKVEPFDLFGNYRMPKFPLKEEKDSFSLLTELSYEGLLKRLKKNNLDLLNLFLLFSNKNSSSNSSLLLFPNNKKFTKAKFIYWQKCISTTLFWSI